jgi:lipopolysaccharide export system protein LptA
MNIPASALLSVALGCGFVGHALAESADRNKPMNIEADSLRYDDVNQISVFKGKVVVSKGSIQIRGAQIEVRQDAEGYQHGVVTSSAEGKAFFRQKREGVDEFIEGEAEVIEYNGKLDTVRFVKQAELRRLRGASVADEITGAVITYENLTDRFTVDGSASSPVAGVAPGRIKATLTPKSEGAAPSVPPANLRLAPTTGGVTR